MLELWGTKIERELASLEWVVTPGGGKYHMHDCNHVKGNGRKYLPCKDCVHGAIRGVIELSRRAIQWCHMSPWSSVHEKISMILQGWHGTKREVAETKFAGPNESCKTWVQRFSINLNKFCTDRTYNNPMFFVIFMHMLRNKMFCLLCPCGVGQCSFVPFVRLKKRDAWWSVCHFAFFLEHKNWCRQGECSYIFVMHFLDGHLHNVTVLSFVHLWTCERTLPNLAFAILLFLNWIALYTALAWTLQLGTWTLPRGLLSDTSHTGICFIFYFDLEVDGHMQLLHELSVRELFQEACSQTLHTLAFALSFFILIWNWMVTCSSCMNSRYVNSSKRLALRHFTPMHVVWTTPWKLISALKQFQKSISLRCHFLDQGWVWWEPTTLFARLHLWIVGAFFPFRSFSLDLSGICRQSLCSSHFSPLLTLHTGMPWT